MNPFNILNQSRGFIPFFVLGDPTPEASLNFIKAAIDAGSNALELGLPFSDPIADGPIIQKASKRALSHGAHFQDSLLLLEKIKTYANTPITILSYCNPLYRRGFKQAFSELKMAGVDAVLIADVPLEETDEISSHIEKAGLKQSFLIAPNTPDDRAKLIHARTTGFTYLLNRAGTTGMTEGIPAKTLAHLALLKQPNNTTPIGVGFGIHTPDQAKQLWDAGADAIIVGSKLCHLIETLPDEAICQQAIYDYIKQMKN